MAYVCVRLQGENTESICEGQQIISDGFGADMSDEKAFIFSETNGVPHNTITPIARKRATYLS